MSTPSPLLSHISDVCQQLPSTAKGNSKEPVLTSPLLSIPIVPLYELHQNNQEELHILRTQVHQMKPLAGLLETLWAAHTVTDPPGEISTVLLPSRREILLQSWFDDQTPEIARNILKLTDELLETAAYLGMDASFSVFIVQEMLYFILRTNKSDIRVHEEPKCEELDEELGRDSKHPFPITWLQLPQFPFLHQCLHKDLNPSCFGAGNMRGLLFLKETNDRIYQRHMHDIRNAIEAGNLRFLELLLFGPEMSSSLAALAAFHGHLHILIWLKANNCCMDKDACISAAKGGHLAIFEWLRKQGCPWDSYVCAYAALNGHLNVLKWAQEQGCPWDESTCAFAAKGGYLEILKWAREKICPWDARTGAGAALNGYVDVLAWALENGCPPDWRVCACAALRGHLDILKVARGKNCCWDALTCAYAAANGHMEILQWARNNGCPWDCRTILNAKRHDHPDIAKWAKERGCPED